MSALPTNYVDAVLDATANTRRKYNLIDNGDGTVSLEDVTVYTTEGSEFSSADINNTNNKVNQLSVDVEECFQSASEGKTLIASALTGKGQPSTSTDTFAQMAAKINNLMAVPTATKNITSNGSNIDVLNYAKVNVGVPSFSYSGGAWTSAKYGGNCAFSVVNGGIYVFVRHQEGGLTSNCGVSGGTVLFSWNGGARVDGRDVYYNYEQIRVVKATSTTITITRIDPQNAYDEWNMASVGCVRIG